MCGHRSTMLATSTCLGATTVPDFPLRSPCPTFEMACHGACRAVLRRVPGQRKVECPCREARSGWHQLSLGRHLRSVEMVSVDAERRRSVGFHWGELYHKSQASRDLEVDRLKRWFRWSLRPVLVGRGQWRLRGICGTLREGLYLLCTASPHHALPGRVQCIAPRHDAWHNRHAGARL